MFRFHHPVEHKACHLKAAGLHSLYAQQGLVEAAKAVGNNQDHGKLQFLHEIEQAFLLVERHIETACAFHEHAGLVLCGSPQFPGKACHGEALTGQFAGKVRRTGRQIAVQGPGHAAQALDGLHIRGTQHCFAFAVRFLQTARLHGLEDQSMQKTGETCRDQGLAGLRIRGRDKASLHCFYLLSVPTAASRASSSA